MKLFIISMMLVAVIAAQPDGQDPCRVTTEDHECRYFINLSNKTFKNGRMTLHEFNNLNPDINYCKSWYDVIPKGTKVCLPPREPCGLTLRVDKEIQCRAFLDMLAAKYGIEMNRQMLNGLNPHIDCRKPNEEITRRTIPAGTEICLKSKSKFEDEAVKQATTLEKFTEAFEKTKSKTRTGKFNYKLFDAMVEVVKEQKNPRRKREVLDAKDLNLVNTMLEDAKTTVDTLKKVINNDANFKALEKEFDEGRKVVCAQFKTNPSYPDYEKCVCVDKSPFIYCQALLRKFELDPPPNFKNDSLPANSDFADIVTRARRSSSKNKQPISFQDFMTKRGCPTLDCFKSLCFSKDYCKPIPKFPILSMCVGGEACFPQPLNLVATAGRITADHFLESKASLKFGLCITDFLSVLSWLGMEACLAGMNFDYYFFKSQLDISLYRAFVVLKLSVTATLQIAEPKKHGLNVGGFTRGVYVKGKIVDDICQHEDHQCEDYCVMKSLSNGEFDIVFGIKLERWWWGWIDVVNKKSDPLVGTCNKG